MFDAILSKFEKPLSMVIAIDDKEQQIHFYSITEEDRSTIRHDIETYKASLFSDEFYDKFNEILKAYKESNPEVVMQKTALVIPDRVILFDSINVPVIKKQAMTSSLNALTNSLYKNHNELKINNVLLGQNKQYAAYSIVGMRKEIIVKLKKICDNNEVGLNAITFNTNSTINGAINFNPDLKTESSVVVDIKPNYTFMAVVVNGKVCGYYPLPFGSSMLYKSRLAAEDLLFDHSSGELLVLNAKERAKSRALTTTAQTFSLGNDSEEQEAEIKTEEDTENISFDRKTGAKKIARKLPKSMLREAPKTREEYVFENFRIYMKWAQDLITFNNNIFSFGEPKKIFVNMPKEFDFLFEMANQEMKKVEGTIEYKPLISDDVYEEPIANNLPLFGGFYSKIYNKTNCF